MNLPVGEGYYVVKNTLHDNFGLPHVIAQAHMKEFGDVTNLRISLINTSGKKCKNNVSVLSVCRVDTWQDSVSNFTLGVSEWL